ncbi:MAG TPA: serine hydrolase [Dehalococcoidia bacterium]|nr:serine hydrolase [Dehalococcoidia bacterium]
MKRPLFAAGGFAVFLALLAGQVLSGSDRHDSGGASGRSAGFQLQVDDTAPLPAVASGGHQEASPSPEPPTEVAAEPSVTPAAPLPAPEATDQAAAPQDAPTPPAPPPPPPPPALAVSAFAVLEAACGAELGGFNQHVRLPPASLTKMVTAMVVRGRANVDETVGVKVSGSALAARGSSVMGLEPGMAVSVLDLLYGLLLPSGNDAALALADYVAGGDVAAFVGEMNNLVAQLGLTNTHFANPHGLDNPEAYSSAYDMAQIGRAYLQDSLLAEIASTPAYRLAGGLSFKNGNKMLASYPGAYGVKIGYTRRAQQTIVVAARRAGRDLVVAVFGSRDRYADAAALLDWAFANTRPAC